MSNAYSAITDTTANTIRISIFVYLFICDSIKTGSVCSVSCRDFNGAGAWVAPSIGSTSMPWLLSRAQIRTVFRRDWNVTDIARRRTYIFRNGTNLIQIFIHRQNRICFHKLSLSQFRLRSLRSRAPPCLAFALQKLLGQQHLIFLSRQD